VFVRLIAQLFRPSRQYAPTWSPALLETVDQIGPF
jgi:hypothetical protein